MKLSRGDVVKALKDHRGCVREAAGALGVTKQAVYYAVERFKIRKPKQPDISEKRRKAALARWGLKETA